jgi:hypothetical protein
METIKKFFQKGPWASEMAISYVSFDVFFVKMVEVRLAPGNPACRLPEFRLLIVLYGIRWFGGCGRGSDNMAAAALG